MSWIMVLILSLGIIVYVTEAKRGLPESSCPVAMLKTRSVDSQTLMTSRCISDVPIVIFIVALASRRLIGRSKQRVARFVGKRVLRVSSSIASVLEVFVTRPGYVV